MSTLQRIVITQGLAADIPALVTGEMGWDVDKKVLRVGDNTPTPVKIMTTKSNESFDFSQIPTITFNNINLKTGGKVAGVDLTSLNSAAGIVVRSEVSGVFTRTKLNSSDSSITVTNGSGVAGGIDLTISQSIRDEIASAQANITSSANPPSTPKVGDIWYNTLNNKKYMYLNDGSNNTWNEF